MIPEQLKRLLQPWLQHTQPDVLIDYIRQQTQQDISLSTGLESIGEDELTVGFDGNDSTMGMQANQVAQDITDDSMLAFEPLQSMHFDEAPPIEIMSVPEKRYRPEVELGRGGMAIVWRAFDPQLHRFVALKQIHQEKAQDDFEVENFMVEAQITAQLQHPGIVPIHELSHSVDEGVYFTMREVQGRTLKDIVETVHRVSSNHRWETSYDGWSLRRLMGMVQNVCLTLAFAHDKGVVHQDIKPTNIMIGAYGEVLLVDWGIAKLRSWYEDNPKWVSARASEAFIAHRKSAVSGTPQYIAPEQLQGDVSHLSNKCDMYALGVMLYEILAEERPFSGSMKDILQRKYTVKTSPKLSDMLRVKKHPRPVPDALVAVCEKAMAYEPSDRFVNMRQMAKGIQDWLDGVQQEEEANSLLRDVDNHRKEITILRDEIETHRNVLQATLEQAIVTQSLEKEDTWAAWLRMLEKKKRCVETEQSIQRLCHAALMIAPHLTRIHQELLEVEFPEFKEVLSLGNQRLIQKVEQRLFMLLEGLNPLDKQRWSDRIALEKRSRMSSIHVERQEIHIRLWNTLLHQRWISIVGMAGVGKTHMAWDIARRWSIHQGAEIFFCDMSGVSTKAEFFQLLFTTLGIHHVLEESSVAIREFLVQCDGDGPVLFFIDNAEHLNGEAVEVLQSIVNDTVECRILVTSRRPLSQEVSGLQEVAIPMPPMRLAESVELFIHHCKEHIPNWKLSASNRSAVVQVVQHLDGIPLAIELAGGRLGEMPLPRLLEALNDRFVVLKSQSNIQHQTLFAAIEWSVEGLSNTHRHLLEDIAICPQSFPLDLVEYIGSDNRITGLDCLEHLEELVKQQLVVRSVGANGVEYSLLSSVREFMTLQLTVDRREGLHDRHTEYFYQHIIDRPILEMWSVQDWTWALENLEHLTMACFHASDEKAWILLEIVLECFIQRGPRIRGVEIIAQLCDRPGLSAPLHLRGTVLKLKMHRLLQEADAHAELEEHLLSEVERSSNAVELSQKSNLFSAKWTQYTKMDLWFEVMDQSFVTGDMERSKDYLNQIKAEVNGWEFEREILHKDPTWGKYVLRARYYWGLWLYQSGTVAEGIQMMEPIVHTYHRAGWWKPAARAANSLGEMYNRLNQPKKALAYLELALKSYSKLGMVSSMNTLEKIGMVHQRQGRYEEALDWFGRALEAGKEYNCFNGSIYCNMGSVSQVLGDYVSALEQYHQGIRILQRKKMRRLEAIFLNNLAIIHQMLGQFEEAERLFLEDRELSKELGLNGHLGLVYGNLGNLYLDTGDLDKALDMLTQCIEQTEKYYPLAKVVFLASLGLGYAMAGDIDRAVKIVKSQPLEEIKSYKEEYIQALCKQVVVFNLAKDMNRVQVLKQELLAIDSSEFAEDSLVSRWKNRIFSKRGSSLIPTVQVRGSKS